MSVPTRSQKLAQEAYTQICHHMRGKQKPDEKFKATVKKFPALIHTCGLAQAVAFAKAKGDGEYLGYLAAVLKVAGHAGINDAASLDDQTRTVPLSAYLRLSREAINAASWLKRYVEAAAPDDEEVK